MYGPDEREFSTLRAQVEKEVPAMQARLGVATVDLPALWDADFCTASQPLVVIVTFSARSMSAASCPSPRRACACEGRGGANRASQVARPRSHDQSLCFLAGHVLPSGDGLFRPLGRHLPG